MANPLNILRQAPKVAKKLTEMNKAEVETFLAKEDEFMKMTGVTPEEVVKIQPQVISDVVDSVQSGKIDPKKLNIKEFAPVKAGVDEVLDAEEFLIKNAGLNNFQATAIPKDQAIELVQQFRVGLITQEEFVDAAQHTARVNALAKSNKSHIIGVTQEHLSRTDNKILAELLEISEPESINFLEKILDTPLFDVDFISGDITDITDLTVLLNKLVKGEANKVDEAFLLSFLNESDIEKLSQIQVVTTGVGVNPSLLTPVSHPVKTAMLVGIDIKTISGLSSSQLETIDGLVKSKLPQGLNLKEQKALKEEIASIVNLKAPESLAFVDAQTLSLPKFSQAVLDKDYIKNVLSFNNVPAELLRVLPEDAAAEIALALDVNNDPVKANYLLAKASEFLDRSELRDSGVTLSDRGGFKKVFFAVRNGGNATVAGERVALRSEGAVAKDFNLDVLEVASLNFYTHRGDQAMNFALRHGLVEPGSGLEEAIKVTNDALAKLANHEGVVYRTMTGDMFDKYEQGAEIVEKGFTSFTTDRRIAGGKPGLEEFDAARNKVSTRVILQSKTGKFIEPFTFHHGEREVLFRSGTRFRVVDKDPGTRTMIWEEID